MPVRRDPSQRLLRFAREMRKSPTESETRLWSVLRSRSLAGYKFRRQHPIGGYILDFYCARRRLAVELDGGQHTDEDAIEYDRRRTQRLGGLGVRVLRFSDVDMLREPQVVADEILRVLEEKDPHPTPLPDYRERE